MKREIFPSQTDDVRKKSSINKIFLQIKYKKRILILKKTDLQHRGGRERERERERERQRERKRERQRERKRERERERERDRERETEEYMVNRRSY